MKAIISPTDASKKIHMWYAPLANTHVEVEPVVFRSGWVSKQLFRVTTQEFMNMEKCKSYIFKHDLIFNENGN